MLQARTAQESSVTLTHVVDQLHDVRKLIAHVDRLLSYVPADIPFERDERDGAALVLDLVRDKLQAATAALEKRLRAAHG